MTPDDLSNQDGPLTGWFDLKRTSLGHVAEILGQFDLGVLEGSGPAGKTGGTQSSGLTIAGSQTNPRRPGLDLDPERDEAALSAGPATQRVVLDRWTPIGAREDQWRDDPPTTRHEFEDLLLYADDPLQRGELDDVLGVGPSGVVVANLTVNRQAALALDLGCGGGLLSLLIARSSDQVLGTDLNPRAVKLAAHNARLNQVENVDFLVGDLFSPVRQMEFDLIVSNPPFVVSPSEDLLYRDSGSAAGNICDRIMAELPSHLHEGGFATIHCHWPIHDGNTWWDTPLAWIQGTHCDLWLVSFGVHSPERYGRDWLANARLAQDVQAAELERWLNWYDRQGVRQIAAGVLVLHKRTGESNWARAIVSAGQPAGNCSPLLRRIFAAHNRLAAASSFDDLLELPFRMPDDCTMQSDRNAGGAVTFGRVFCEPDPGYSVELPSQTAPLIERLDGVKTPGQLLMTQPGDRRKELEAALRVDLARLYGAGFLAM